MQEWMDRAHEQAKDEKLSAEAITAFIAMLYRPPQDGSTKKEDQLMQKVVKLQAKQVKVSHSMQEIIQKVGRKWLENRRKAESQFENDDAECSEEEEEVGSQVYKNLEPTISLK